MAIPNQLQSGTVGSTTAAPVASLAATITASTLGTALVMHVAAICTTAPAFTPTAGFVLLHAADVGATPVVSSRWYIYPNNPGGLTSIGVTGLNTCQGVTIHYYEFDQIDCPNGVPLALAAATGNGTNALASGLLSISTYDCLIMGSLSYESDTGGTSNVTNPGSIAMDSTIASTGNTQIVTDKTGKLIIGTIPAAPAYGMQATTVSNCLWVAVVFILATKSSFARVGGPGNFAVIGGGTSPANGGCIG